MTLFLQLRIYRVEGDVAGMRMAARPYDRVVGVKKHPTSPELTWNYLLHGSTVLEESWPPRICEVFLIRLDIW